MDFNEYQEKAYEFAVYKDETYPYLGLAEEAGEVLSIAAKSMRKHGNLDGCEMEVFKLREELGDVLWMVAAIASDMELSLEVIAMKNIYKLTGRKKDDTIVER